MKLVKLFIFIILSMSLLVTAACGKKSPSKSTTTTDTLKEPNKDPNPVQQDSSSLKRLNEVQDPVVQIPVEASKDYSSNNKTSVFTPVPPSKDLSGLFEAIPEGATYEEPKGAGGISQPQDWQAEVIGQEVNQVPAVETTPEAKPATTPAPRATAIPVRTPNPMPAPPPPPAPVYRPTPVSTPVATPVKAPVALPTPRIANRPDLPSLPVTTQENRGLFPDTSWRKIWVKVFPMTANDRTAYETSYPQTKNKDYADIKNSSQVYVVQLQTGRLVAKANSITFANGSVRIDQAEYKASDLYIINYSNTPTQLCWDGNRCYNYRGQFVVKFIGNSPLIINVADLENEYLAGVVPIEMSPSWPVEALKAQAISARTYALFEMIAARKLRDSGKWLYDILPTTNDQAYLGTKFESASVNTAINGTRGGIITYKCQLVLAQYHGNSGGRTCSALDCGGYTAKFPYLASVPDMPEVRKYSGGVTTKVIGQEKAVAALSKIFSTSDIKSIKSIKVENNKSERTTKLFIDVTTKSGGSHSYLLDRFSQNRELSKFENALRFPGRWYEFAINPAQLTVTFYGNGHGIGMSQWGANLMAQSGKSGKQIVEHFYSYSKVTDLNNQSSCVP